MPTPKAEAERIKRLENAIERLSQNVVGLSTSLALIGEINDRQADLEERASLTEAQAREIARTAVNKEMLQRELVNVRAAGHRRTAWLLVGVLVMLGLISYTRYESVTQIKSSLRSNYILCTRANAHIQYEVNLISHSKSPDKAAVHDAVVGLEALKTPCDKFFGPANVPHFLEGL